MRARFAATVGLAAWGAALVAAGRVLAATGADTLTIPLTSARDLAAWAGATPPADMAVAVLRLAGIAACAYLLVVTALGVLAQALGWRRLAGAVGRASPRVVRRLVAGGSGVGLAVGTLVAAAPVPDLPSGAVRSTVAAVPGVPAPDQATMSRVGSPAAPPGTATMTRDDALTAAGAASAGSATMTRMAPAGSATMTRDAGAPDPSPAAPVGRPGPSADRTDDGPSAAPQTAVPAPAVAAAPALPTVDPTVWVVAPGDSLWSIADEVVRDVRPGATGREVSAYWRGLVAANRASLVDPENPDLLVPGQRLIVPPAP